MNIKMLNSITLIIKALIKKILDIIFGLIGYEILPKTKEGDFYLHKYSNYEEYRKTQIFWNKKKINHIWADEKTLKRVCDLILNKFEHKQKITGICHGTRNGFEQKYLKSLSSKIQVIGTDISETANYYENSIQWDFHDKKDEWINANDFIYTNSLDQSWKPDEALNTWLNQLKQEGILILEHTERHGPSGASEMDPFGVKPTLVPYVLTKWFGSQISISHTVDKKSNKKIDAWLFVISKNEKNTKIIKNI
jgi:hypothetical protein